MSLAAREAATPAEPGRGMRCQVAAPAARRRDHPSRIVALAGLLALVAATAGCASGSSAPAAPTCGRRTGTVTTGTISSRALNESVRWDARSASWSRINGDAADRPLLVLLHGAGTDPSQWTDIGLDRAFTDAVATHQGPTPVVLTPDVKAGTPVAAATRFLAEELIPLARRCFGATDDPAHRAVGGISAGGMVALFVAAARPDLFSVAGGHSPAVHTGDAETLARDLTQAQARVQLDAGEQDGFRPGTTALGEALQRRGTDVSLRIPPGQHDRPYWRSQLPGYLSFYFDRI